AHPVPSVADGVFKLLPLGLAMFGFPSLAHFRLDGVPIAILVASIARADRAKLIGGLVAAVVRTSGGIPGLEVVAIVTVKLIHVGRGGTLTGGGGSAA